MTPEEAGKLVDAFEHDLPGAYKLARVVSLAVSIERELLRKARLALLPEVDAGAEADLWFSPLVETQSPLAMVFVPEVADELRARLKRDQKLLKAAWELLGEFHRNAPPALYLEEELTWLALSETDNADLIERRLQSVMAAMASTNRPGLARWAARALPALPEKARNSESARILSVVSGAQMNVAPALRELPRTGGVQAWMSRIMRQSLPTVPIGVRLLEKSKDTQMTRSSAYGTMTEMTPDEFPLTLELSYPPNTFARALEVPQTNPLLLEVSWQDGEMRRTRQVSLVLDKTQCIDVPSADVNIRTAFGDIHALTRSYEYDLIIVCFPGDAEWVRRLVERLRQEEFQGRKLRIAASDGESITPYRTLMGDPTLTFNSRKIGVVVTRATLDSLSSMMSPETAHAASARDFSRHLLLALTPLDSEAGADEAKPAIPVLEKSQRINFFDEDRSDESYYKLLSAITGQTITAPEEKPAEVTPPVVNVFISYAHEDKNLRDQLDAHFSILRRTNIPTAWHDHMIEAGTEWKKEIDQHINSAHIILLLISADFINSDYAYDVEIKRAMERQEERSARVIPIILRPTLWEHTPFAVLQALPAGAKPVTEWTNRDNAFASIAEGIHEVIEEVSARLRAETASTSTRLPLPAVNYVARRDAEGRDIVERLKEELAPGTNRAVVLWGAGGVGKTAIAAEAARALSAAYNARVVWVSAENRADFSFSTLLDEIELQLAGSTAAVHAVVEEKERRVRELIVAAPTLVILDGFEWVTPADQNRCREFLFSKRADQDRFAALVTTRRLLSEAVLIPVDAMPLPDAVVFVRHLAAKVGDRESFASLQPERIASAAGGVPLLMQWLVTQIEITKDPERVLDELARGEGGDAAQRIFDRTFNSLPNGEASRGVLLALSLFEQSASYRALAEVAGLSGELPLFEHAIDELRVFSLLSPSHSLESILAVGQRLTLNPLTRNLARARMNADPRAPEFRTRFLAYFLNYPASHSKLNAEDFAALEVEKDNVLAAFDVVFKTNEFASVVKLYSTSLPVFLNVRGYWDEAMRRGLQAMEAARAASDEVSYDSFTLELGAIQLLRGEYNEAESLCASALRSKDKTRFLAVRPAALELLGTIQTHRGQLSKARESFELSLRLSREFGNHRATALALSNVAWHMHNTGDLGGAERLYNESLLTAKAIGDEVVVTGTLGAMAALKLQMRDLREAERLYEQCLELGGKLGFQKCIAMTTRVGGHIAREKGELEKARERFTESLSISQRLGYRLGVANALRSLGTLDSDTGRMAEAQRLLDESGRIFASIGYKLKVSGESKSKSQTVKVRSDAVNKRHGASGSGVKSRAVKKSSSVKTPSRSVGSSAGGASKSSSNKAGSRKAASGGSGSRKGGLRAGRSDVGRSRDGGKRMPASVSAGKGQPKSKSKVALRRKFSK